MRFEHALAVLLAWLGAEVVQQLIAAGEQLLIQKLVNFLISLFNGQQGFGRA